MLKVILFSDKGRRPVSATIHAPSDEAVRANPKEYIGRTIAHLCLKKGWTQADLRAYGYKRVQIQPYEPGAIAQENREHYNTLRKELGWS